MVKGWAVLITLSLLAGPVHAELRLPVTSLADTELDQLRGGFVMNNLEISIGLEQVRQVFSRITDNADLNLHRSIQVDSI